MILRTSRAADKHSGGGGGLASLRECGKEKTKRRRGFLLILNNILSPVSFIRLLALALLLVASLYYWQYPLNILSRGSPRLGCVAFIETIRGTVDGYAPCHAVGVFKCALLWI